MNNYPRFQYSFFIEGKDTPQIVVRGDKFEDFILDVEQAKKAFVPLIEVKPIVAQPSAENDASYCPIHKLTMKERVNAKNNSKFFSHYIGVYPNGKYCSGKV